MFPSLRSGTSPRFTNNGSTRWTPTSTSTNRLSSGTCDAGGNLTNWNGAAYGYDRLNMPTQLCSSGTLAACSGENYLYAYTADDERILGSSPRILIQ